MKYIRQFLYILAFTLAGEALAAWIPAPIPAAIYGLVLMFLALCTGLLKPKQIEDTAGFFIRIMPLLFIAPGVQLLEYWDVIAPDLAAVLLITVVSTWVVFAVSGLVTQWLLGRKEAEKNG